MFLGSSKNSVRYISKGKSLKSIVRTNKLSLILPAYIISFGE